MTDGRFTGDERTAAAGRAGARGRKLSLARVERELPPTDSPEHVRAGMQLLQRWGAAGLLPGSGLVGCVRAGEGALKALAEGATFEVIEQLRQENAQLAAERDEAVARFARLERAVAAEPL